MEAWHLWALAALSLSILELFTVASGFLLLCIAFGCLLSAAVALVGLGVEIQVLLFSVASVGAIFGIRPLFRSRFTRSERAVKTNADALVGKIGIVSERLEPFPSGGRALVEGEDWWAVSRNDAPVEPGSRVKIVQVDGSKLIVENL